MTTLHLNNLIDGGEMQIYNLISKANFLTSLTGKRMQYSRTRKQKNSMLMNTN